MEMMMIIIIIITLCELLPSGQQWRQQQVFLFIHIQRNAHFWNI